MATSGDIQTVDMPTFDEYANTRPLMQQFPEVAEYFRSGTVPAQVLNQVATSGLEPEAFAQEELPLFGTHLREAAEIVRRLFKS